MQASNQIIIVGAGGHAKVILSALLSLGKNILGVVDDNPALQQKTILGYPILGTLAALSHYSAALICAIGDNKIRQQITTALSYRDWVSVIHARAYVHESVKIGVGTVIFAGAVVQPDTVLGQHVIVNTGATIDHDCHIADYAHLAPGSHLAGHVQVGEGALLGIGASVNPTLHLGKWTTLGAGSVVVRDIDDHAYAKGVPAKVYRVR